MRVVPLVHEILEGKLKKNQEVPADCGTALDHCENVKPVVADNVVDERGKSCGITMEITFVAAAASCAVVVLLRCWKQTRPGKYGLLQLKDAEFLRRVYGG